MLQPPETDLYHPAKHYDLGEMCYQGEKHLEHAITAAGGDGFYDKKRMHAAAIRELVDCDMPEFCSALGVSQDQRQWPPEIQQAWIAYSTAAATEVTHAQGKLQPMPWTKRAKALKAIAVKHGKHARQSSGW